MNFGLKNGDKHEPHHTRSKYPYLDQTHFIEWVNRLGLEKTFLGRTVAQLDTKFHIRKVVALFIFSFMLSVILFFDVEFTHTFKAGEIATVDVKSPISFEIIDEVETESKRLQASSSVPAVFDYEAELYDRTSNNIYNSFRSLRGQMKLVTWSASEAEREEQIKNFFQYKSDFEKMLGYNVPDRLFEWLVEQGFSVRIENVLIRYLEHWSDMKLAESAEKIGQPGSEKIILRVLKGDKVRGEFTYNKNDIIDLVKASSYDIRVIPGVERIDKKHFQNLEKMAQILLVPNLTPNIQETTVRRKKARDAVLPVMLSVKKNQVIVSAGAVVQPVHVTLMREIQNLTSNRRHDFISLVTAGLFVILIIVFFSYVRRFTLNKVRVENKDVLVMGLVTLIIVLATKFFLFITDAAFLTNFGQYLRPTFFLYLAPVAAGPMLVGLLITSGEVVWLFSIFLAVALGLMVDMNFSFTVIAFVGGIAAARGVYGCKKRNDIYKAGFKTGLINALTIFFVTLLVGGDGEEMMFLVFWNITAGFFSGIFASMLAMIFIPVLETLFNYTTDVRLLELSNLNHPLLKEMLVKAPGTYHHSMMVGSMVEAAAEEIGANPLLAKVMAFYHDIGKVGHSNYFIENQKRGFNLHDQISPFMSKTILVAHVKDGVEQGMKYKLGKPIIDGIIQHHGSTLISYFFNKAVEQKELNKESDKIGEDEFRYPGPRPQFCEAGLLMLADSIEAAARSLDEPTPVRLQNIVRNIIQRKFMDGQLDYCNLTLRDLSMAEKAFINILLGIYHQRIDYPKSAGGGASEEPDKHFSRDSKL